MRGEGVLVTVQTGVIGTVRDAVASRRVSAEEAVQAALDRIEKLDKPINAVVAMRAEEALAEARELDRKIHAGHEVGPLAGVPVLVKDLEDVTGMRTTMGSVIFADAPPAKSDGLIPSRLRAAGAIVVGKDNLPEFACEGYTTNLLFGTTRNPWALDWSPGGSSGGSGAALSAGMVPIATATDGGGSIRIPSAFCGLVGIKPSGGTIPRRPIPDWIDFSTDGPLATTVADLRLLLSIEAGPEPGDPTALPNPELTNGLRPKRLLAIPRFGVGGPLPDEVTLIFEAAVRKASEVFGLEVEQLDPGHLWTDGNPDEDWFVLATAEHVQRLGRVLVEANLGRMHVSARSFMEYGLSVTIDAYLAARRRRFGYVRDLDLLIRGDAVILSPTVISTGFLADGRLTMEDEPGMLPADAFNTGLANITGHPAMSLPAGVCSNGVPFGLQVMAARFRDATLLDLAEQWEQANPWPRTAPGYDSFETELGLSV